MNSNRIYSYRHDDRTEEEQQGLYSPFVAHAGEIRKGSIKIPEATKRANKKFIEDILKAREAENE